MDDLPRLDDVRILARWLDSSIPLPFGIRIGWDGLVGLVPVVGNLSTTVASLYIVSRAAALGTSEWVLFRMGMNIVVDNLFDGVPVLGTFFDFAWKSNEMNVRLLEAHLRDPRRTRQRSLALLVGLSLVFLIALAGVIALGAVITILIFKIALGHA